MHKAPPIAALLLSAIGLAACHDPNATPQPDLSAPPDLAFPVAPHAPLPQVPTAGGPIIAHPTLVTITYPGFSLESQMTSMADWLMTSSWLTTVGAEYGIGAGTHMHVQLTTAAPATITQNDINNLVASGIADHSLPGDPRQGMTTQYIYALFLPAGTVNSDQDPSVACAGNAGRGAQGYHTSALSLTSVPIAVLGTCANQDLPFLQLTFAHEVFEAASDPYSANNASWIFGSDSPWLAIGGELADLCEGDPITIDGYDIQRSWSNAAAAAGTYPCIPAASTPYFNVSPAMQSVTIAAGASATITVTGWSTGELLPWFVSVGAGYGSQFVLGGALSADKLGNGDTATLTLSVPASAQSGQIANMVLYSSPSGQMYTVPYNQWALQVVVQ